MRNSCYYNMFLFLNNNIIIKSPFHLEYTYEQYRNIVIPIILPINPAQYIISYISIYKIYNNCHSS